MVKLNLNFVGFCGDQLAVGWPDNISGYFLFMIRF